MKGGTHKFSPVYLIVITDFDMKPFEKRMVNEIILMERNTNVVLTEDVKIMFVSLNQVAKEWDDCKTELERRLYLIQNMEKLNKNSKPYLTGEYEEMFNASEMACMAAEDIVEYRNSLVDEMERESELEYAKEYAKEEGLQEGRAEGRAEAQLDMAKKMKLNGLPLGDIMLYTGLTEEQVRDL